MVQMADCDSSLKEWPKHDTITTHSLTIVRIVEVDYPAPTVIFDSVDDCLMVIGPHTDGVIQEPRRRCGNL